jgi:hypothetical protein
MSILLKLFENGAKIVQTKLELERCGVDTKWHVDALQGIVNEVSSILRRETQDVDFDAVLSPEEVERMQALAGIIPPNKINPPSFAGTTKLDFLTKALDDTEKSDGRVSYNIEGKEGTAEHLRELIAEEINKASKGNAKERILIDFGGMPVDKINECIAKFNEELKKDK